MSCPYCESPFLGSHFGDCPVSENLPRYYCTINPKCPGDHPSKRDVCPVAAVSQKGVEDER